MHVLSMILHVGKKGRLLLILQSTHTRRARLRVTTIMNPSIHIASLSLSPSTGPALRPGLSAVLLDAPDADRAVRGGAEESMAHGLQGGHGALVPLQHILPPPEQDETPEAES